MGFLHLADTQSNSGGPRSFKIVRLESDGTSTPTGMREEALLLSWLIVLLRTQEGGQVSYEWAYGTRDNAVEHEGVSQYLSTDVMTDLQSTVGQSAAAVSRHIKETTTKRISSPVPILLSTSFLSRSEKAKDEGALHLEVLLNDGYLKVHPVWYTENMLPFTVTRYIETLADTIKMCISDPNASIEDCLRPTNHDLDQVWRWNHQLPPTYDFCMHEMISQQAQKHGDKEAISSWDGSLTYFQVDRYSTLVACSLKEMGVKLHDFLPVCFEKSKWTIVAVLAVMKAGATLVMMDPSLPLARLQNMAKQVNAKTILSSRQQHELSTTIIPSGSYFVVEAKIFTHSSNSQDVPKLPTVPPSALMYIIFTSGSTGTPKGVKISHQTYTSSAIPRAKAVGYTEDSRVLDFASYAFDVSIDSMLLTLGNGGCLCIPSDEDRLNDINGAIRKMQINYAGLTPSVARILDSDVISSLSGLGLGGEAVSARDATIWGQDTRIIIGYGPCECTIGCTVNSSAATGRDYISIGPGNGAVMWIVDPNDHESLMPVGAVGELLVEGPIVGQGYLNDPEKTAAAFINDPSWLLAGHNGYAGRRGRLYKTGDLGKWDPDGSGGIVFAGRKDTQVKLRGQRVELGEIESQLRDRLPAETTVIVEVIVPQGSRGQPTLVAFLASKSSKGQESTDLSSPPPSGELRSTLSKADADLAKVLPRYMVPNAYIPVNYIPTLISGKTDRKRLKQFGATLDLRKLDQETATTATRELSDLEKRLRQAWSLILKLDGETIRPGDNFFALGGDSLAAMKLVSACRDQGLELTVTGTFGHPTLSAMAEIVQSCEIQVRKGIPAFSMVSQPLESACLEAAQACEASPDDIEDIYLSTPTQESLFTFSLKSTKAYVAQRVACIPSNISLEAWKNAWEDVVAASPILRTRLVQLQDPGLQQVVLKESISWKYSNKLAEYLDSDRNEKMHLGQSLARYAIVDDLTDGKRYMVWTIHHVLYDGWSEPLVLEQVQNSLQAQNIDRQTHMRDFVKYVRDTDEVAMQNFWRCELNGAVGPQFPRLPYRDYLPSPDGFIERQIPFVTNAGSPFTLATLIRGAWALVASQYTRSDDVVFGETLTGRDISLSGVENIVGPLIATLPIRVHVNRASSVESYLQTVQQSILARTPYQHMGMQNIRKVSRDAQHACEAGTGLVIQPEPEYEGNNLGFDKGDVVREALHFNPYPLMIACGIQKGGFRVCASFDTNLVEIEQMKRVLGQLEIACIQLAKDFSRRLGQISCLPDAELNQIWQWNHVPPLPLDKASGTLRADVTIKQGSIYPPAVVPWVCDPRNPSLLSPIGCAGELWLEGTYLSGSIVESPAWLVTGSSACAGRTGRVQPTGDMVRLRDDGSLTFVGRKENVVPVQGHAVDIADVESYFTRHLPSSIRAAAAIIQPSSMSDPQQKNEPQLIAFVERQAFGEDHVELMSSEHAITLDMPSQQKFKMTICATVPVNLAVALKRLDKFIQDSLPSHMIPFAYVVVDKMSTATEQVDRNLLNQVASRIPQHTLDQLREGFHSWKKSSCQTNLTATETILRSAWAKILGINEEQIDVEDNFFRLGGDSVLAMKLASSLRADGHSLTVADIFQHMRLGDAAKVLKVDQASKAKVQPYKPFSTLNFLEVEPFLSQDVRPKLANSNWSIRDVSPVTDSQALDIKSTIQTPRTSIQYNMLYFEKGIDRKQLFRACNDLIKTHEILRTVFIKHESTLYQVVLDKLDIPVPTNGAVGDIQQYVSDLCKTHIESDFQLGSPFVKFFHVDGKNGEHCLIIGLSHALYDGLSLPRLLQDLGTLYIGKRVAEFEPFSSYMARICDKSVQTKAVSYWSNLLKGSSLSILHGTSTQPGDKGLFQEKSVSILQPPEDITTANLLTAAWALLLARRLQKPDVTFGSVTSGRGIDLTNVENIMGPCYQLTPVRVPFKSHWTATDLLHFVQKQSAESAANDFLGFERISQQCTEWSCEARFFDSIVHHQDFDDFDTMPFAGGTCKVDISNPHGDAPYPFKAVSFVRGGQMHVGVVGSERDANFVHSSLDELVVTVQELATHGPKRLFLDGQVF
ncbi:AMP-binding enzyme [Penicillium riverlandense]|uniref:AMP-binding enzyme n=1 Tax=Penicillium riverlandense TaxID=1903569 RepID=UPI002548DD3D|nr:AMP-binding enzyme [Penicillium riverlandense]KAJ5814761.1 AMP-binding enzyme [Penicillium riverlandense]